MVPEQLARQGDLSRLTHHIGNLAPGQLALVLQDVAQFSSATTSQLKMLLSDEEIERNNRFKQSRHRHRDIVRRGLLRMYLSQLLDTDAGIIPISHNENGKPYLQPPYSDIHFNTSHSGDLVVLAFCRGVAVGVDIECVERVTNIAGIAEHFFATPEIAALQSLAPAQQRQRFYDYWTLKEAYLKARGEGIFLGLDKFFFEFDGQSQTGITIGFGSGDFDHAPGWQFKTLSPLPKHRIGIAIPCAEPRFEITVHQ